MRQCAYGRVSSPARISRPEEAPLSAIGLQKWHGFIKSQDPTALRDLLHPDVVFESPVVHTPQRGRDITFKYLISATKVLGGPGFR